MKQWTIETLVAQLRHRLGEAGFGDILDPGNSEARELSIGDAIDAMRDADFRKRMVQIEGQTTMIVAENGDVKVGTVRSKKEES